MALVLVALRSGYGSSHTIKFHRTIDGTAPNDAQISGDGMQFERNWKGIGAVFAWTLVVGLVVQSTNPDMPIYPTSNSIGRFLGFLFGLFVGGWVVMRIFNLFRPATSSLHNCLRWAVAVSLFGFIIYFGNLPN